MTWQIAITISILANATTILIKRRYAQKSTVPATFPAAASYLLGVIPVGLLAGFLVFPHHIYWSWWLIFLMAIQACSMGVSGWSGFASARHLGIAPQQTIGRLTNITAVLLGWTVLGEKLSTYQLLGGAILLTAAMLAIWSPIPKNGQVTKQAYSSAILLAIISAVTLGVALFNQKVILGHVQIGGIFLVDWTSQTVGMLLLATKDMSLSNLRKFRGSEVKWSALMGAVNGFTGVFYIYALKHSNNISLLSTLTILALPLTVVGAYLFLGEREHHKLMWTSLGLSLAGLLVTSIK